MDSNERLAEIIQHVRYPEEDKIRWSKLIKDFNSLYYSMGVQTWGTTQWRGVSVLKPPTDMWIYQELIYEIKPDLIIETGSFFGGSALFMRDVLNLVYPEGKIISIDIDHSKLVDKVRVRGIEWYLGDSVAVETVTYVKALIAAYDCKKVMVILDSDHSEKHVSRELELYTSLVTRGSILIVEDASNCPGVLEAIQSWALRHDGIDFKKCLMGEKYMITFCRDGFWEKIV